MDILADERMAAAGEELQTSGTDDPIKRETVKDELEPTAELIIGSAGPTTELIIGRIRESQCV